MNAPQACAPHGAPGAWHRIDWVKAHGIVRKLQTRIVKAWKAGRYNKVKALQWLLTHSWSGKALAVKRVTENPGKNTPGVDRETWSTPEAKSHAISSLSRRGYQAHPLRRVSIPKANGKKRPLGIATLRDRAMQTLYLHALQPIAETTGDPNSYGFRVERCTADAAERCFMVLARKPSARYILDADIQACFDEISHNWLLANIPTDRAMLQKWLKAGFIDHGQLFPTTAGTPQGGSISPTLMNMTLDGLEGLFAAHFGCNDNPAIRRNKVHAIRYADDMIVTGATKALLEQDVIPLIEHFLAQRGLKLSPAKTHIVHIAEGFDFLGWNIRKYGDTLLIKPAKANVHAFLTTIRDTVKAHKTAKQVNLIGLLNPIIRGWAHYHRGAVAKQTFSWVDAEIWRCLWQWAKRRHPNKSRYWIVRKYFHRLGTRHWVFAAQTDRRHPDGKPVWIRLWRASDVPIRRHAKVRGDANPFDPEWESYFEQRLHLKMHQHLRGRGTLLALWTRQDGGCPQCAQQLTEESGWHLHHRLPRSAGGKDNLSNLMLVHPNCHRQVHAKGGRAGTRWVLQRADKEA